MTITGPSGSDKSTIPCQGLDSPTSGEVHFRNAELGKSIKLDTYPSRNVRFIFQAFHLTPTLRAVENAQVPILGKKRKRLNCAKRAYELLKEMGMDHRMDQYPDQLSADERQRVAIARAPVSEPEILLADEPTGNRESINTARTMETLTGIQKQRGITLIVMMTHENEVALAAARQIRIRGGKVEASSPRLLCTRDVVGCTQSTHQAQLDSTLT
jgi:putative ABC transport system ATP-binding protein